jgi:hypothetical protein
MDNVLAVVQTLHRREFYRLVVSNIAGRPVSDHDLDRSHRAGDGQGNEETETVVAVSVSSQHSNIDPARVKVAGDRAQAFR